MPDALGGGLDCETRTADELARLERDAEHELQDPNYSCSGGSRCNSTGEADRLGEHRHMAALVVLDAVGGVESLTQGVERWLTEPPCRDKAASSAPESSRPAAATTRSSMPSPRSHAHCASGTRSTRQP